MYINQVFELSMVLDSIKFRKVFDNACGRSACMERNEDEYIDHSMEPKGITVIYRDSQYKKKIRVLANVGAVAESGMNDPEKFIRKLDKRIGEYFGTKYKIDDFTLSGLTLTVDIKVDDSEMVSAYLRVLRRIGRVKGFTPVSYDCFEDDTSFCLEGNSNGIEFLLYDLKSMLVNQLKQTNIKRKELRSVAERSEGALRAEVRLTKPKAIKAYARNSDVSGQIKELIKKCEEIFMDTFTWIIPFGEFYKKDKAIELIHRKVADSVMRRKMLRLLALIPEKRSLYLAQKTMNCRNIEKVMDAFAKINVSPVTISKRHDIKYLNGLYAYLIDYKSVGNP